MFNKLINKKIKNSTRVIIKLYNKTKKIFLYFFYKLSRKIEYLEVYFYDFIFIITLQLKKFNYALSTTLNLL